MSHQDPIGHTGPAAHDQDLKGVLDWLLAFVDLSGVRFRKDCTWTPRALTGMALLWAWSGEAALTERFDSARKIAIRISGLRTPPATSYQASLKMLRTWTAVLAMALVPALRRRMEEDLADRFLVAGFPVFGVDGSRLELPRTESNEAHFAPTAKRPKPKPKPGMKASRRRRARARAARAEAARAKKANSPQMWLTTMWHVGTGLPWDWRLGPSGSSERDHLKEMIAALPAAALVTADAGFVGYEYWEALRDSGRHLLIRVGANVRLLKGLGDVKEKDGLVYLWPDREAARDRPPLVLRLVVARGGRHPVYLVTSVRDEDLLSDQHRIQIYSMRWGIELFYRHFKQTFGRRKLRSQRGDHAEVEAIWSLLGLWSLGLHAEAELARQGVPARRVSVAGFLRAYRGSMREYRSCPGPGESLRERLSEAVIDEYKRTNKASRDYPRKKHGNAIGAPVIRPATEVEIEIARRIKDNHATRLTA